MKATILSTFETRADGSTIVLPWERRSLLENCLDHSVMVPAWEGGTFVDAELVAESMEKPVDLERARVRARRNCWYDSSLSASDVEQGAVMPAGLKYNKRNPLHRQSRSPDWPERYRAAPLEVRCLFTKEFLTAAEVGLLREHIEPHPLEPIAPALHCALPFDLPLARAGWLDPQFGQGHPSERWLYRGCLVWTEGVIRSDEERELLVREVVMKRENRFAKLARLVALEERMQKASRREPIPDGVRMFVWQRDRGCCVQCGSKENLEFDHIIPVVKGGSNTERNLQLLCESCNRSKSGSVGGL